MESLIVISRWLLLLSVFVFTQLLGVLLYFRLTRVPKWLAHGVVGRVSPWFVLLLVVCWSTAVNAQQKRYEKVTGTVVAYDKFSGICIAGLPPPCKMDLIVQVATVKRELEKPSYIKVAYLRKDGENVSALFKSGTSWRFKLRRDTECTRVEEFQIALVNGKYEMKLPRWVTLSGAPEPRLPLNETIPCYQLQAGGYKPQN